MTGPDHSDLRADGGHPTPEQLLQACRDRGKVLRLRPGDDGQRIDFIRIHGSVLTDRYAGLCPPEDTAHIYHPEDVADRLRDCLSDGGTVLRVDQENTRWGRFDYGSD